MIYVDDIRNVKVHTIWSCPSTALFGFQIITYVNTLWGRNITDKDLNVMLTYFPKM